MATSDAQKRSSARWNRMNSHNRSVSFYVNRGDDMALLAHLDKQPNKQEYIKSLIRNDMEYHDSPRDI